VFEDSQTEVVVGMEVRDVDVDKVLPHQEKLGDHPMGVAGEIRGVYEDRVPLSVEQHGTAVEAPVTVKEHSVLRRHGSFLLAYCRPRARRALREASVQSLVLCL
jgi:hypothetical protein